MQIIRSILVSVPRQLIASNYVKTDPIFWKLRSDLIALIKKYNDEHRGEAQYDKSEGWFGDEDKIRVEEAQTGSVYIEDENGKREFRIADHSPRVPYGSIEAYSRSEIMEMFTDFTSLYPELKTQTQKILEKAIKRYDSAAKAAKTREVKKWKEDSDKYDKLEELLLHSLDAPRTKSGNLNLKNYRAIQSFAKKKGLDVTLVLVRSLVNSLKEERGGE